MKNKKKKFWLAVMLMLEACALLNNAYVRIYIIIRIITFNTHANEKKKTINMLIILLVFLLKTY